MPIINSVIKGGGQTPTGTKNITANGVYDVTTFASADVQVPTTAPTYYIEKSGTGGVLSPVRDGNIINLNGITDISSYALTYTYAYDNTLVSVDLSNLTQISGRNACDSMFYAAGNTSLGMTVDMSNITKISGTESCKNMFYSSYLTSINLDSLETIGNAGDISCCEKMFENCSRLTTFPLTNLKTVNAYKGCYNMFYVSSGLMGSINLSKLTDVSGDYVCQNMFYGCPNITSVNLSGITDNISTGAFNGMFQNCTGITSIDLSNLVTVNGANTFSNVFNGCTGLTSVSLPSLISCQNTSSFNNMFYNCTSLANVTLTNLAAVSGSNCCQTMFRGCTALTSISFPSLWFLLGSNPLNSIFQGCTSLTDIYFPSLLEGCLSNTALYRIVYNLNGVTIHFPSNLDPQSGSTVISSLSTYPNFGGTNTVLLYDLPAVSKINMSSLTKIKCNINILLTNAPGVNIPQGTSVDLSSLVEVDGKDCFYQTFSGKGDKITSVNLSSLKYVFGSGTLNTMFYNTRISGTLNLSKLEVIKDNSMHNAFGITDITGVNLDNLCVVGTGGCGSIFYNCSNLTTVNLKSLKTITEYFSIFDTCSNLTDIYFPALYSIGPDGFGDYGWRNDTCTVHFPSNMQSTIESLNGYSSSFGGAAGISFVYDLPATNHLVGANSVEYERNPKYDTASALAWRVKDTGEAEKPTIDWTPFYTSGTTSPAVSDTIYSDDTCTTVVTTISSII